MRQLLLGALGHQSRKILFVRVECVNGHDVSGIHARTSPLLSTSIIFYTTGRRSSVYSNEPPSFFPLM